MFGAWKVGEKEGLVKKQQFQYLTKSLIQDSCSSHSDNPVRNAGPSEVFFSSISSPFRFSRSETWGDNQVMKKIEKGTKMFSEPQNKNHEKGESKIVLG